MSVTSFVWNNNYHDTEQVRPYLADFLAVKREITDAGKYPYNDSFKGRIPGLAGSPNEDTGIYLLQTLADLENMRARIAKFLDDGGSRLTDRVPNENERGTLVRVGFYMGGTGWSEHQHAKVKIDTEQGHARVLFKLPRQRLWRTHHDGPDSYLFVSDH